MARVNHLRRTKWRAKLKEIHTCLAVLKGCLVHNVKYIVLLSTVYLLTICLWYTRLPPTQPSILCSFGTGRLGNQLSSFATQYAFSRLYGYRHMVTKEQKELLLFYLEPSAILPELHVLEEDYQDYYFSIFGFTRISRLLWDLPWKQQSGSLVKSFFNYSVVEDPVLRSGHAINSGDYPNEVQYFVKVMPELREIFRLDKRFKNSAWGKLYSVRSDWEIRDPVFVSVHIRRGDYGEHLNALYNLNLLDENYFRQAMEFFRKRFTSVIFAVVSDDPSWAREHLSARDVIFLGNEEVLEKDLANPLKPGKDVGEDLALLAACNHSIMSFGTYGMWGSLLAGGTVVVPWQFLHTKEGVEVAAAGLLQAEGGWHVIQL